MRNYAVCPSSAMHPHLFNPALCAEQAVFQETIFWQKQSVRNLLMHCFLAFHFWFQNFSLCTSLKSHIACITIAAVDNATLMPIANPLMTLSACLMTPATIKPPIARKLTWIQTNHVKPWKSSVPPWAIVTCPPRKALRHPVILGPTVSYCNIPPSCWKPPL